MAVKKHKVVLELEPNVNVTMDVAYDTAAATAPYTVSVAVLNSAGEKYNLSGKPSKAKTTAKTTTAK